MVEKILKIKEELISKLSSVDKEALVLNLKGEYVGNVGTSGNSIGYHLHFDCNTIGAYRGGENSKTVNYNTCVDPSPFFPKITRSAKISSGSTLQRPMRSA